MVWFFCFGYRLIDHVIGVCPGEETVSSLISGEAVEVRTDRFENDFETFRSRHSGM